VTGAPREHAHSLAPIGATRQFGNRSLPFAQRVDPGRQFSEQPTIQHRAPSDGARRAEQAGKGDVAEKIQVDRERMVRRYLGRMRGRNVRPVAPHPRRARIACPGERVVHAQRRADAPMPRHEEAEHEDRRHSADRARRIIATCREHERRDRSRDECRQAGAARPSGDALGAHRSPAMDASARAIILYDAIVAQGVKEDTTANLPPPAGTTLVPSRNRSRRLRRWLCA
jgi:hypothetical protein